MLVEFLDDKMSDLTLLLSTIYSINGSIASLVRASCIINIVDDTYFLPGTKLIFVFKYCQFHGFQALTVPP